MVITIDNTSITTLWNNYIILYANTFFIVCDETGGESQFQLILTIGVSFDESLIDLICCDFTDNFFDFIDVFTYSVSLFVSTKDCCKDIFTIYINLNHIL